ncbi:hypothetical protein [Azospirillum rugosum]|uniref:hypothetical protein n=1 Tax=Azospirillum rugosum TaxID=416170 RepID=UPI003619B42D
MTLPPPDTIPPPAPPPALPDVPADPVAAQLRGHADALFASALEMGKLLLETAVMQEVLEHTLRRLGVPVDSQAVMQRLRAGAARSQALPQACERLAAAASVRPEDFRSHFWHGLSCLKQGDEAGALEGFGRAAGWFAGAASALHYAAEILERQRQDERATRCYAAAVAAAPNLNAARRRLAERLRPRHPEAAARHFRQILGQAPCPLYGRSLAMARTEAAEKRRQGWGRGGEAGLLEATLDGAAEVLTDPPDVAFDPDTILVLIDSHRGFHVVRWRDRYAAVSWHLPAGYKALLCPWIEAGGGMVDGNQPILVAGSLAELERKMDDWHKGRPSPETC